jgi:hypothetical protein
MPLDASVSKIKYPDLTTILNQYPNPHILLGKDIVWQEKRDGSNLRVYIDADGKLAAGSRNMDIASEQFQTYFKATPQCGGVEELLRDAENWDDTYVVFGELLIKGKSPTKIEFHEDHSFVVFDIWSNKLGGFFNYTKVYQECYHNHLPVVEMLGTCKVSTLESLLDFRDTMLMMSKRSNREGTVGKTWDKAEFIYFKEKNDIPRYEKVPRKEEDGKIILPDLPDSEVTGAIEKVYTDLGVDFFVVGKAMPIVAEYVKIECQKHNCRSPRRKLFDYYQDRCKELRMEQEK